MFRSVSIRIIMLLEGIHTIDDLRKIREEELPVLAAEIRELIIDVISKNGGHLAPSLGVVELTMALHYVFNTPEDRIIWDVGHQTYAHKILTGRRDSFPSIRKFGGISGFPKRNESVFDTYDVGHSSTSLSLAQGEAVARDILKKKNKVIAVIGDGSITNGMAFEALNHMGHKENDLIIILNDNEHSICKNVGALPRYLNRIITGNIYNRVRRRSMDLVRKIPTIGDSSFDIIHRFFDSFKGMIVPGQLFEDMGIRYFGPVDGHDLPSIIELFRGIRDINSGPKIIHVLTTKGMGYLPAEENPSLFHGIGPFDRETGKIVKTRKTTYSDVAGNTLLKLAAADDAVVALTAAMKLGTGLYEFEQKYPNRFFDVGISEQHMMAFAAAMASSGLKPFVSIYSTFLQRAYDQLIHDIALMNHPVRLLIDRAGIVGDDGETHHGLCDITMIRSIPNFTLMAPSNGDELALMIRYAATHSSGPLAIRYPRGEAALTGAEDGEIPDFRKPVVLAQGDGIAIFAIGDMVKIALEVREILASRGLSAAVVKILTIKPLDIVSVEGIIEKSGRFMTLENGFISGGFGEHLLACIGPGLKSKLLFNLGFPNEFVTHGTHSELLAKYRLDRESIADRVLRGLA